MKRIALLILVLFISACANQKLNVECNTDSDCSAGGCSGQVCASKDKASDIITTCEYKEEYGCYRLTSCGCINNKCTWEENTEFKNCLEKY